MPVLMIGKKPLFERLGTPSSDKRHVIFDAGHAADYPRSQTIREVVRWLDRYLGPVNTSSRTHD